MSTRTRLALGAMLLTSAFATPSLAQANDTAEDAREARQDARQDARDAKEDAREARRMGLEPIFSIHVDESEEELGDRADEPSISLNVPKRFAPRLKLGDIGSLRPILLADVRSSLDKELTGDRSLSGSGQLSRLWLGLKFDLFRERLSLKGRINLQPGNLEVIDYYLDIVAAPQARVRVGVMKVPFTRYRMQSSALLAPISTSDAVHWFGAEYQLGVMVTDKWQGNLHYAAGVFSGKNTHASQAIGLPKLYGVDVTNPSSLVHPDVSIKIHPEFIGMISFSTSDMGAPVSVDRQAGPWRFAIAMSAAVDTRPDPLVDFAARLAPELVVRGHHVMMRGIYYAGFIAPRVGRGPWKLGAQGTLAEITWAAHRWVDLFARYNGVWWTKALAQSASVGVGSSMEVAAGLIIPIIGDQLKFTTDFSWSEKGERGAMAQAFGWQTQFQVAF